MINIVVALLKVTPQKKFNAGAEIEHINFVVYNDIVLHTDKSFIGFWKTEKMYASFSWKHNLR